MIIPDANLLIYAYHQAAPEYNKAKDWWEATLSGEETVGLPWASIQAFIRVVTNPALRIRRNRDEAVEAVEAWLACASVRLLSPGDHHWAFFREMVSRGQAGGNLVSDAHLAALALEYGGELHTTDRDFARFPGLRWRNPLTD